MPGSQEIIADLQRQLEEERQRSRRISLAMGELRQCEARLRSVLELREREQLLELFVEHAPAAIAMTDRGMRYLAVSKRWVSDYGLEGEELIGRSHYEVFPELPERWKTAHRRCLAGSVERSDEDAFVRADGSVQWLRWEIRPWYSGSGVLGGLVIFSEDITENMRIREALLHAKEAAETANKAKSRFLANMSHEIRTPLSGILGMTELALMEPVSDQVRQYLELGLQSGRTLLKIINDILDVSAIEAGKVVIESITFDIRKLVGQAVDLLAGEGKAKGLRIHHVVDSQVPDLLVGDPGRLQQVLTNLAGNAIKFTEEGEVVVSVVARASERSSDEISLLVSVRDTGIGIAPQEVEGIFKPFGRVEGPGYARYSGTGLGLPIARNLVERMGGRIWLESEPGRGSTFFVNLPLRLPT